MYATGMWAMRKGNCKISTLLCSAYIDWKPTQATRLKRLLQIQVNLFSTMSNSMPADNPHHIERHNAKQRKTAQMPHIRGNAHFIHKPHPLSSDKVKR